MNPPPVAMPIDSPCNGVCRIDPASGLCDGCARTLDEIAAWGSLTPAARAAIIRSLASRRREPPPG